MNSQHRFPWPLRFCTGRELCNHHPLAAFIWSGVLALIAASALSGQELREPSRDATERGFSLMNKESLGSLKLEMSAKDITSLLGKPEKTGKDIEWEALGEFVQQWSWPESGIVAEMVSGKKGGNKKVLMFTAKAPWDKATSKGIRIGSTEAEVRAAYGAYEDKEMSKPGSSFIAGSVYGGLQFTFTKGKVTAVFFGASAE